VKKINNAIKAQREKLGLTDIDVAKSAGLSIHEYADIEQYEDELKTVTHLCQVRRLCAVLEIDLYDLFNLDVVLSNEGIPVPKLVREKRKLLDISKAELAEKIGFEELVIDQIENQDDFFEDWSFELIKEFALAIDEPVEALIVQ
jgi:transcriptional regulator with XRE-family HTH domain